MLLLSAAARPAALLLALAASPAAAGPSLRGSRALQSGDAPDSMDAPLDGDDGESHHRPFTARLGEEGCALRERPGPPCDDPDVECEQLVAFDCVDAGGAYRVENDMVGISTGDGTFAFEHDAGAHLLEGNGDVTFRGEATINLHTHGIYFVSGTFVRDAPATAQTLSGIGASVDERDVDPAPDPTPDDESIAPDEIMNEMKGVAGPGAPASPDVPAIPTFPDFQSAYASGDVQAYASGSADAPSEEAVRVAGTAAVSQSGFAGTLNSVKGEYEDGESVTLDFSLSAAGDSGYKIGIFMRMANPQDGALAPIASLQLPPGLREGSVTFSRQTMGMMNWPLDLYQWGTGYDAYVLDGNGAEVVGPAQFNILLEE